MVSTNLGQASIEPFQHGPGSRLDSHIEIELGQAGHRALGLELCREGELPYIQAEAYNVMRVLGLEGTTLGQDPADLGFADQYIVGPLEAWGTLGVGRQPQVIQGFDHGQPGGNGQRGGLVGRWGGQEDQAHVEAFVRSTVPASTTPPTASSLTASQVNITIERLSCLKGGEGALRGGVDHSVSDQAKAHGGSVQARVRGLMVSLLLWAYDSPVRPNLLVREQPQASGESPGTHRHPRSPIVARARALLLQCPVLLLGAVLGCSDSGSEEFPGITPPKEVERGILKLEATVRHCHQELRKGLEKIQPGDAQALAFALSSDFLARFPGPQETQEIRDPILEVRTLERSPAGILDARGFIEQLESYTRGWQAIVHAEFELDSFLLEKSGDRATGTAELYLAGLIEGGGRADLRMTCEAEFTRDASRWLLARLDLVDGLWIRSDLPGFFDATAAVGLDQNISSENSSMLQAFIDEHRTLALGGLSAVDWNEDGFWDVIASLNGQISTLFLNDGVGGFVRGSLPISSPDESPVFMLYLDLDGDGTEELASTRVRGYHREWAGCGLYQRAGEGWDYDKMGLRFRNPVGLRRISVNTIVPFDLNDDGLLDLFLGSYGDQNSRGRDYNLVEAHDGGDNYLFVQVRPLRFSEESAERGLEGSQYTYVALPLDFDGDGDEDLFEGNDFGPNVLWVNDGAGSFAEDESSVFTGASAYTMGVTLADHDDDGHLSMYVVNMSSEAGARISEVAEGISEETRARVRQIAAGNQLYEQDDSGEWIEVTEGSGCAEGEWGWGALFCDLDGDGDEELLATNGFTSHSNSSLPDWDPYFWRQVVTDGALLDRGEASFDVNAGLNFEGSYAGFQRDRLFYALKGDQGRFVDVAFHFGLDNIEDGRCVLALDVDGDGDLDLVMWTLQGLRFYENRGEQGPFARLRLEATTSHPAALGARVRLRAGGVTHHDMVQAVEGFQTQVPLDLHFNLPGAENIEFVEVTWRSGETQRWENLPTGRLLHLVEGVSSFRDELVPSWPESTSSLEELQERGVAQATGGATSKLNVVCLVEDEEAGERQAAEHAQEDVELRVVVDPEHAGQTFVHDEGGRLRRAFRRMPSKEDLERLLESLRDEPPFPELLVLTGRRRLMDQEPKEALAYFERALAQSPQLAIAAEGVARSQRLLGNLEESERAYELSVEIDPDYAIGHYNLGVLRSLTGRAVEALASYREALRISGEHPDTLLAYGEAALVAEEYELALEAWKRASLAAPLNVRSHVLRGQLLGQLKRYSEAKEAFEGALAIDPEQDQALRGIKLLERLIADEG